jgi:hypothetical protein
MVYRLTKELRKFHRTLIASVARMLRPVWHCECEVGHTRDPKIKAQPDDISVRGIELEPAVARLMTKASLDGSPRSPRSPEPSMNYARTQWKLALHWQGFFFFGELDARPCHISQCPRTRRRDEQAQRRTAILLGGLLITRHIAYTRKLRHALAKR